MQYNCLSRLFTFLKAIRLALRTSDFGLRTSDFGLRRGVVLLLCSVFLSVSMVAQGNNIAPDGTAVSAKVAIGSRGISGGPTHPLHIYTQYQDIFNNDCTIKWSTGYNNSEDHYAFISLASFNDNNNISPYSICKNHIGYNLFGMRGATPNDFIISSSIKSEDLILTTRDFLSHIRFATTETEGGDDIERMIIRNDGKIGINTRDPIGTFDIVPLNSWWYKPRISFSVENSNSANPSIRFYRPTGGTFVNPTPSIAWWIETTSGSDVWKPNAMGAINFMASAAGSDNSISPGDETSTPPQTATMKSRMTIRNNGNVGVNYELPISKLHVHDGAILFEGSIGSTPKKHNSFPDLPTSDLESDQIELGAGSRFMWVPELFAIRAGRLENTNFPGLRSEYWNSGNIGFGSVAMGYNVLAQGNGSVSLGLDNKSEGIPTINDPNNPMYYQNEGHATVTIGHFNIARGGDAVAIGYANSTLKDVSYCFGHGNSCNSLASYCIGRSNHISGAYAYETSMAVGDYNYITSQNSFTFGRLLKCSNTKSMVIGIGAGTGLENNIEKSLMIGFDSNIPTLFVGSSNGVGTIGKIGIGTTSPTKELDVSGNVTISAKLGVGVVTPACSLGVNGNVCFGWGGTGYLATEDNNTIGLISENTVVIHGKLNQIINSNLPMLLTTMGIVECAQANKANYRFGVTR
ncbi:MAG: hypothetical protein U0Y96_02495 [Candidatus Kapaibacterium sp.]